jgi:hypothetical protein
MFPSPNPQGAMLAIVATQNPVKPAIKDQINLPLGRMVVVGAPNNLAKHAIKDQINLPLG